MFGLFHASMEQMPEAAASPSSLPAECSARAWAALAMGWLAIAIEVGRVLTLGFSGRHPTLAAISFDILFLLHLGSLVTAASNRFRGVGEGRAFLVCGFLLAASLAWFAFIVHLAWLAART